MKKVVFLPYDFDTAIGINNEGSLAFSYNLEDIDQVEGGADVFNGQQSVLWINLRNLFFNDIRSMYQTLRSQGILSYEVVEQMFENHQSKWPEAIFNEDAYFKYLQPLIDDGSGAYLAMLQGSKSEQRKWWLYNRFKYLDSKYNAGDALTDVIQVRGYAKDDITITPYADVYPSVKFGSYLVQERGERNTPTTIICPLDNLNDTEIYIYSASQLSSVGDLSGLKVGFADFSMATHLQSLKLGDSSQSYTNGNLTSLTLGNNELLQTLDVRNCPNLAQSIDISGCTNIEEVYFTGTNITGLSLPNGGILRILALPASIANLTIRNQPLITNFSMPNYSGITTLRLENIGSHVPLDDILSAMAANSRVRLIDFTLEMDDMAAVDDFVDELDTMRGLDEQGGNLDNAVVSGTITGLDYAEDTWIDSIHEAYSELNIEADLMIDTLNATNNGMYTAATGHVYNPINVAVPFVGADEIAMGAPGGDIILHTTSVAANAFRYKNVVNVYSDTVTSLGANAFSDTTNLQNATFTAITELNYNSNSAYSPFSGSYVKTLNFPNLTALKANALRSATKLQSINMPNLRTCDGNCTFYNCGGLLSINLLNVTSTGQLMMTFYGCNSIEVIVWPGLVNNITSGAFSRSSTGSSGVLKKLDLGSPPGIIATSSGAFYRNPSFTVLIIRKTGSICSLADIRNFNSTPFASGGTGGILYVPQALVSAYQEATNWSTILGYENNIILPIEGSEYEHYYADGTPIEEE